jgi:hypothetical protein
MYEGECKYYYTIEVDYFGSIWNRPQTRAFFVCINTSCDEKVVVSDKIAWSYCSTYYRIPIYELSMASASTRRVPQGEVINEVRQLCDKEAYRS